MAGLSGFLTTFQGAIVAGVWALVIAAVGYVVGLVTERIVVWLYRQLGIKHYMEESGYEKAVVGVEFEVIIKELAKWWVFLVFLAQAAAVINLYVLVQFFQLLLGAYTLLAVAVLYFSAGALLAHYVGEKLREAGVFGGNATVALVKAAIIYISAVTALQLIRFTILHAPPDDFRAESVIRILGILIVYSQLFGLFINMNQAICLVNLPVGDHRYITANQHILAICGKRFAAVYLFDLIFTTFDDLIPSCQFLEIVFLLFLQRLIIVNTPSPVRRNEIRLGKNSCLNLLGFGRDANQIQRPRDQKGA